MRRRLSPGRDHRVAFYGVARTENGRGITIPSQQRFVRYFESLVTYHNDMDAKRLNSNSPNGFERPMYSDATAVELLRSSMLTAKSNTNDGPDDTDIYEEDNEEDNEEETDINDEEEGPITEDKVRACITKGRQACESAMKQQDFLRTSFRETPGDLLELSDRELMLRQLEACAVRRCNPDCDPLLLLSRYRICCTAGRAARSAVRAPTRTEESVLLRVIEFFFNATY